MNSRILISTMTPPVGRLSTSDRSIPVTTDNAENSADMTMVRRKLRATCRAVTGGMISRAETSSIPTSFMARDGEQFPVMYDYHRDHQTEEDPRHDCFFDAYGKDVAEEIAEQIDIEAAGRAGKYHPYRYTCRRDDPDGSVTVNLGLFGQLEDAERREKHQRQRRERHIQRLRL